jgi:hypothetical protein
VALVRVDLGGLCQQLFHDECEKRGVENGGAFVASDFLVAQWVGLD